MVLGKGYQLKMLLSDEQIAYLKVLSKNMHARGIFCDFAKAFDCMIIKVW